MSAAAGEVRAAAARLREAGAALRRRPARETLAALAGLLEAWRDPTSPARVELERELPPAAGFSPAVVREGLSLALEAWTGEALLALVARELGGASALDSAQPALVSPFALTATLLAGALPAPTLLALVAPLALRSPTLARPSSHDPVTARAVVRSLATLDAGLAACLEVVSFPADDVAALDAFVAADCVVATGSDATVASVAARVRPPRRFVGFGHRLSLALVGPEALRGEALSHVARGLALDVALWDQLGCLSPICVLVVADDDGATPVAEALAQALQDIERQLPRGRVGPAARALFASERGTAELRAAAGRPVAVLGSASEPFCVVREEDASPRPAPLHRFVRVCPLAPGDLVRALTPFAAQLAGVAVAGFGPSTPALVRALADLGASRICPPGRLQAPPLAWHHDGQGVLLPLARSTDLERG